VASVLIIEDSRENAELLRELVETPSVHVEVAYSGLSGIAQARRLRPEIVLCDIGLPDMDGYAVARTIRADVALSGSRLVAYSGFGGAGHETRALEAGFDMHLTKPVEPALLEMLISEACQGPDPSR
jgi:CheY-like chemotaxis protein